MYGQYLTMINQQTKQKDSKIIEVHTDLIEILEKIRTKIDEYTYGSINGNVGYKSLTQLLAKKIKMRGGIP